MAKRKTVQTERPRPSRESTPDEMSVLTIAAVGAASWAIVIELMIVLEERKILSDKRFRRVFQGAAATLEALEDIGPHPVIDVAHALILGHLDGWSSKR